MSSEEYPTIDQMLARDRAAAVEEDSAYARTVLRLEPDIAMIDPGAFYASAAISLRRIADAQDRQVELLTALLLQLR